MTRLEQLAQAIAAFEGFYVTEAQAKAQKRAWPTIPQRFNNPGDLVFVGQPHASIGIVKGKDGITRRYAKFDTVQHGWEALYRQIKRDATRGLTLWQFIRKYAPAADANDPAAYFAHVAKRLGARATDKLADVIAEKKTNDAQ